MSSAVVTNISFEGIHCINESVADGFLSGSDEIYITSSVSNMNGNSQNFTSQVFEDVDTGEYFHSTGVNSYLWKTTSPNELILDEQGVTLMAVGVDLWEADNQELVVSGEYTDTLLKGLEKAFKRHTNVDGILPGQVASSFATLAGTYANINEGFKDDHIGTRQFLIAIDTVNKQIIIDGQVYSLSYLTRFSLEFKAPHRMGHYRADFLIYTDVMEGVGNIKNPLDAKRKEVEELTRNMSADDWNTFLPNSSVAVQESFRKFAMNGATVDYLDKAIDAIKNRKKLVSV